MSNQLTAKTATINSMRIALKLVANNQAAKNVLTNTTMAANVDNLFNSMFAAIKPCSLAQAIGESAIDLEIDVSSLDGAESNAFTGDKSSKANQQSPSFSDYFAQAISHIEQQQTVLLSHPALPYRLLMMPAIVAAKHRCHPHAYLTGLGEADDMQKAIDLALMQAKRSHVTPTQVDVSHLSSYTDKFTQLIVLIGNIAMRTLPNTSLKSNAKTEQTNAKYWFTPMHQSRVASFNFTENNLQHAAIFVQGTELAQASSMLDENRLFLPIAANTLSDMIQTLAQLSVALKELHQRPAHSPCDNTNQPQNNKIIALMYKTISQFDQTQALSAVIMASSLATAIDEIEAMLAKINASTDSASITATVIDYKTPAGSCLSVNQHQALGLNGVCFVYPGVGTVYPHMLTQLPRYFPALFAQLERDGDLNAMLQADSIYAEEAQISDMSLAKLAIAGAGASYILTKVLSEYFGIKPHFAMGYSMGEASMWASLNVWKNPYSMIKTTQNDPIFTSDITGELNCVRQAWQLAHGEDIIWNSFVVRAAPSEINAVLADYPRVYLAIKQGDTCVLAGCEQSCKALLKHIGKRGIAANRVTAMHTAPAMLVHDKVYAFYQQPLHEQALLDSQPSQIKFISAASKSPISLNSEAIAKSIADTFCQPLDFTALVNHARKLGASLFVEIGADRQTSTLIDKIARNAEPSNGLVKPNSTFTAIAANTKGDDQTALLKCIAQLISHKVPLSLNYLTDSLSHLLAATHALETRQQHVAAQLIPQLQGEQS